MSTPVLGYSILHQPRAGVGAGEYEANLLALHDRIGEEAAALAAGGRRSRSEMVERESSFLRGALAQYLETPLRTDDVDIRRLLGDTIERSMARVLPDGDSVVLFSRAGRMVPPPSARGSERRLFAAGKAHVGGLGFPAGREDGDVYESLFVVKGGAALDTLEEIVRDRLGIGAPPHGVHLSYFGRSAYALHNLVLVRGSAALPAADGEVVFLFEKPRVGYGEFRDSVGAIADRLLADLSPERIELWQRKLGLGVGTEFILRVRCRGAERAGVAAWMAAADAGNASAEALVRGSSCVFTTTVHA